MTTLSFSDLSLNISDLPTRAKGLGEEETSDILGGFGSFGSMRRRRMMKIRRRRAASIARRRRAAMSRRRQSSRKRRPSPRRRGNPAARAALMRKASFHGRMASMYRARARRA